jgi:uncharacterized damage-inducible protein DinB
MAQRALMELLRGTGAHVDPIACVEDLSAEQAMRRVAGFPHSIFQLVFHMNYWLDYELRRIRGENPRYPEHNSESFSQEAGAVSASQWDIVCRDFAWFLAQYAKLAESTREQLDREIENPQDTKVASSLEAILSQIVAHNSYHLGQIALIRQVLGTWPPRAGGDTW